MKLKYKSQRYIFW